MKFHGHKLLNDRDHKGERRATADKVARIYMMFPAGPERDAALAALDPPKAAVRRPGAQWDRRLSA